MRKGKRLPAEKLKLVTADHIWRAVERLVTGNVDHQFSESTNYDVIADDGTRLAPKAVFGLAATEALGFEILPSHFTGGINTACFKVILSAGYPIVQKGHELLQVDPPPDPEGYIWEEGNKKFVLHLRRERGSGLSQAKKRDFRSTHGRLYCQLCKFDPEEVYGPDVGEACIEVHHKRPLGLEEGVRHTKLGDLMCVCANCHRIIHRTEKTGFLLQIE